MKSDNSVRCHPVIAGREASLWHNFRLLPVRRSVFRNEWHPVKFEQFPDTLFPVHLATVLGYRHFGRYEFGGNTPFYQFF